MADRVTVTLPATVWADVRGELVSAQHEYERTRAEEWATERAVNAAGRAARLRDAIGAIDEATTLTDIASAP